MHVKIFWDIFEHLFILKLNLQKNVKDVNKTARPPTQTKLEVLLLIDSDGVLDGGSEVEDNDGVYNWLDQF